MITETTLRTLVNKKQYDTAFVELSRKGQVTFDTRYTDGGNKIRVIGGTYRDKYSWSTTMINDTIKDLTLSRS